MNCFKFYKRKNFYIERTINFGLVKPNFSGFHGQLKVELNTQLKDYLESINIFEETQFSFIKYSSCVTRTSQLHTI